MRSQVLHLESSITGVTFASGSDALGVSGDFAGGFVLVTAVVFQNVGVGQWAAATLRVDGVAQGQQSSNYQSGANLALIVARPLRVPRGRHRISVYWSSGGAPVAASCAVELTATELPA